VTVAIGGASSVDGCTVTRKGSGKSSGRQRGFGGVALPNGLELSGPAKSPSDYRADLAGSVAEHPGALPGSRTKSRWVYGSIPAEGPRRGKRSGGGSRESLCGNLEIASRVPTGGHDRAPAMHTGPTSVQIRASPQGRVPTGPALHTVWRRVGRQGLTSRQSG
jgi:hypothetical protein